MAVIVATAAQIAPVDASEAEIYPVTLGATVTAGSAVYLATADGFAKLSDANAAAAPAQSFFGVVLKAGGTANASDVLRRGRVYGFDLSDMGYGATAYVSATAGAIDTAPTNEAGGTIIVGYVTALADADRTKVLLIDPQGGI